MGREWTHRITPLGDTAHILPLDNWDGAYEAMVVRHDYAEGITTRANGMTTRWTVVTGDMVPGVDEWGQETATLTYWVTEDWTA
jgi:hypothetical protein